MQYGAVDTRNLATDLTKTNHNDIGVKTYREDVKPERSDDANPTTVNKIETPPVDFKQRLTGMTPKCDSSNWLYLQGILEELYSDIEKVREVSTNNGCPDEKTIRREEISHQASNELKSQARAVQTLCYDTTRTINILTTLQNIDQEGSWYHTTSEQAKAILRFRQADAHVLMAQGIDASRGIMHSKNGEWKNKDGVWGEMKIHTYKTTQAIKAANQLLQRYPPRERSGQNTGDTTIQRRDEKSTIPNLPAKTSEKRPISKEPVWQQPTERTIRSKQELQNQISTTTDVSSARRDLYEIIKTMDVVSVRMDGEITSSNPNQDVDLQLHASKEDVIISEVEGGKDREQRKQVGRVEADIRQDKAEVTSTMVSVKTTQRGGKETRTGAQKTEPVNGEPNKPNRSYTREEKYKHASRVVPKPEGWTEYWDAEKIEWFYGIQEGIPPNERRVWGLEFKLVMQTCEKDSQGTDTAGKKNSGSVANRTMENNSKAIGGIPDERKNRQADNATGIEIKKERAEEKAVEEPNIKGESDKEKTMRAKPRSQRSRDKIGRSKSTTRRGSRDKQREHKSRSKSRE